MIKFNFLILTAATFFLSLLDTYFYPGFSQKHFNLNPDLILLTWISITLLVSIINNNIFYDWFKKINNRFLFPFLLIFYGIILFFEKNNYPNFVFTFFHVHRLLLLNLVIISGIIFYISYPKFISKFNQRVYLLAPLLITISYFFYFYNGNIFFKLIQEDGYYEYLQFFLYLFSSILSTKIFLKYKEKSKSKIHIFFFLLLSLGLFFVAGEEISWGQRIFNIQTPPNYAAINTQKEITIHNLNYMQKILHSSYILVALYGLLSNYILRKLFPKKYQKYYQLTLPFSLTFYFLALFIHYVLHDYFQFMYILTPDLRANMFLSQEIVETYLSIAMFLYTYKTYKTINNKN